MKTAALQSIQCICRCFVSSVSTCSCASIVMSVCNHACIKKNTCTKRQWSLQKGLSLHSRNSFGCNSWLSVWILPCLCPVKISMQPLLHYYHYIHVHVVITYGNLEERLNYHMTCNSKNSMSSQKLFQPTLIIYSIPQGNIK